MSYISLNEVTAPSPKLLELEHCGWETIRDSDGYQLFYIPGSTMHDGVSLEGAVKINKIIQGRRK